MPYHILAWGLEGGLLTTTLTTGDQVVLVHTDEDLASRLGSRALEQTQRGVATVRYDLDRSELRGAIERALGDTGSLAGIDLVFPDDPRYVVLLNQLLG